MKRLLMKSAAALVALSMTGVALAQDIKERTFKFAMVANDGHPAIPGMKKFAELVSSKSGGKMKVNLFLGGSLGSDQAIVSAVQGGTVEMSVMNSGILASIAKELAIFDFPFMFNNEKESDAIVDGQFGTKMHKLLEPKGIIGLSYWELGYRQITNSKRPIKQVDDIKGLKLRVIPNPINVAWVKALGANPTPLPITELYSALEQGAVDGQENPVGVIVAQKFWETQKYMAISNHQYNPQSVIFSKKVWDSMSAAEKKILADSANEAAKFQRKEARAVVASNIELLKKNGMTVTELPPSELAILREKMKPIISEFSKTVGEDLVTELQGELAKLRK